MTEDEIADSWKFAKPIESLPHPMKKIFDQIDDLCARAGNPSLVCAALGISRHMERVGELRVSLGGRIFILPDGTHLRWRRVWRAFLTDHVDDVANSLAAVPAVVPGGQPAATA